MIRNILMTTAIASSLILAPVEAMANNKKKIGAALLIGTIACGLSKKCRDAVSGKKGKRTVAKQKRAPKPRDAVSLTRDQKFMIQEGLNQLGYSTNGIDGVFGGGTRSAIRGYQRDRGYKITGLLTAAQASELMSNAPRYASINADDDRMFEIEFARDVSPAELAEIQRLLNLKGYDAGPVDGKLGRRTIKAIAAYKKSIGVGGPAVPTKRVLAKLEGREFLAPGGVTPKADKDYAGGKPGEGQGVCTVECERAEGEEKPAPKVATLLLKQPEDVVSLSLLGARTGMTETDIELVISDDLDAELEVVGGIADDFGGNELLSSGLQVVDSNWPELGSSMVSAYFDEAFPELGAFVIVRTISLGDDVGVEAVEESVLPQIVEEYGEAGKLDGTMMWITDPDKLATVKKDAGAAANCGLIKIHARDLAPSEKDLWSQGAGPRLDLAGFDRLKDSCGDVLSISHTGHSVTLTLWNTDMLLAQKERMGGVVEDAPKKLKIKF